MAKAHFIARVACDRPDGRLSLWTPCALACRTLVFVRHQPKSPAKNGIFIGWGTWTARDKSLVLTLFGPPLASAHSIRLPNIGSRPAQPKNPIKNGIFIGWGTWTRTKTYGIRIRYPTIR